MSNTSQNAAPLIVYGTGTGVLVTAANAELTLFQNIAHDVPIATLMIGVYSIAAGAFCINTSMDHLQRSGASFRLRPVLGGIALGVTLGSIFMAGADKLDNFFIGANDKGGSSHLETEEEMFLPVAQKVQSVCVMPIDGPPPARESLSCRP